MAESVNLEDLVGRLDELAEFYSPPKTAQEVRAYFSDVHRQNKIYNEQAKKNSAALAEYLPGLVGQEQKETVDTSFEALYDPSLLTVAIDAHGAFTAYEVFAWNAQRRRTEGQPSCNVVIIPTGAHCGELVTYSDKVSHLIMNRGVLFDTNGVAHAFNEPMIADMIVSGQKPFAAQCEEVGMPVTTTHDFTTRTNKPLLSECFVGTALHTPVRYSLQQLITTPEILPPEFVIKPSDGMQGKGVRFFEVATSHADAVAYAQLLEVQGYKPLIEERIMTWPLEILDEHGTLIRLDWNTRVIAAHGKVAGMYIRIGGWGKAINISQGASAIKLEELGIVADPITATMLMQRLTESAELAARQLADGALAGIDLTIDEHGRPCIFEVNVGILGGPQTITRLYKQEQQLAWADNLLDSWLGYYKKREKSEDSTVWGVAPLHSSMAQLLPTAQLIGKGHVFAGLPLDEAAELSIDGEDIARWAVTVAVAGARENMSAIRRKIINLFPLEAARWFRLMPVTEENYAQMLALATRMHNFSPHDRYWQDFLAVAEAQI